MNARFSIPVFGFLFSAASIASAATISYSDTATFFSTLQVPNPITLNLPKFDDMGGTLTLTDVLVSIEHRGSVDLAGDNDDPTRTTNVRGQMVRRWSATGPGVIASANRVTNTPLVFLGMDDGDGGNNNVFDPTGPDGHDFGTIAYGPLTVGPFLPAEALYLVPGTADFVITALTMANQLEFDVAPQEWQLEVENPTMDVTVNVTYTYVPEPSSLCLLSIGGLTLIRRRRIF